MTRTTRPLPFRRAIVAALVLVASAAALAQDAPPAAAPPTLPAGIVARVYGEDITEAQLLDRLGRRFEGQEKGREILDQIVDDQIVADEAARRGISVTDDEARAFADRQMGEVVRMRGGKNVDTDRALWDETLDRILTETHTTRAELYRVARDYVLREKMARTDLGTKDGETLPEHRMKLWQSALRRKSGVRYDGLPAGVLARVGDSRDIDRARFARELRVRLPVEVVAGIRAELVLDAATRHAVSRSGVSVTQADVDAQIARLREKFEKNPRVQGTGVSFDSFLRQTFGIGEEELRHDPTFRSKVGLEHMLGREIDDARVRRHWDENRAAYGERALVRQVFVAAAEEGSKYAEKLPSFREASDLALRAKVQILEKAGLLKGGDAPANLGDIVTQVAKQFETSAERRARAGEPVAWTRQNVAGETALEAAVFDGEIGRIAGPVRSNVGYHVLYVEERRPAPGWDEVKVQVREDLLRMAVRNFQLALRADGDVVLADLK